MKRDMYNMILFILLVVKCFPIFPIDRERKPLMDSFCFHFVDNLDAIIHRITLSIYNISDPHLIDNNVTVVLTPYT